MKKILYSLAAMAALFTAASCQNNKIDTIKVGEGNFIATFEVPDGATKTYLDESNGVLWNSGDEISINGCIYTTNDSDTKRAVFEPKYDGQIVQPVEGLYTAVYPMSMSDWTFPATQIYESGRISNIPMRAVTDNQFLAFRNLCGVLQFTLKGDIVVKSITVSSDGNEYLTGPCAPLGKDDCTLRLDKTDPTLCGNTITLDCGEGVQLSEDGTKFYIALPSGLYAGGLTIEYKDVDNRVNKFSTSRVNIERNKIYPLSEVEILKPDYLCFTGVEDNSVIGFEKVGNGSIDTEIEYSWDQTDWQVWEIGTSHQLKEGGKLYVRASSINSSFYISSNYYLHFTGNAGKVDVSGSIMSLIDGRKGIKDFPTRCTHARPFCNLFSGLTCLRHAKDLKLPSMQIPYSCYESMFSGCTNLISVPELPATSMNQSCYLKMFYNCSSLVEPQKTLPATKLASSCYQYMFSGCTKLESAPELPATELSSYCYYCMFNGCTKLKSAPNLPATNLSDAEWCYSTMFNNCTSLTTAPELPATKLANACYLMMFYGCTNLTTVQETLPAMSLYERCYESMFKGCVSLETAPDLPATSIADNCYYSMFKECSNLKKAPDVLPATIECDNASCYSNMFEKCTSLEKAPALPSTTLAPNCYAYMFEGATSLKASPVLAAGRLESKCYYRMFYGCSSLSTVTMLATPTPNDPYFSFGDYLVSWLFNAGTEATTRKVVARMLPQAKRTNLENTLPRGTNAWSVDYCVLMGNFSVGAKKTAFFSNGNLQATLDATGAPTEWNFAPAQHYIITDAEAATIGTKAGLFDLFGWSTSTSTYGISTSKTESDYSGDFVDWGKNAIANGGNQTNLWCTLSKDEWTYLIETRTDANRFAKANLEVVCGLIIFPDGYNNNIAVSGINGVAEVNRKDVGYPTTSVSESDWSTMEEKGCVFLPAAGNRYGQTKSDFGSKGRYWSSTLIDPIHAYTLYHSNYNGSTSITTTSDCYRSFGSSVRLVIAVQ